MVDDDDEEGAALFNWPLLITLVFVYHRLFCACPGPPVPGHICVGLLGVFVQFFLS